MNHSWCDCAVGTETDLNDWARRQLCSGISECSRCGGLLAHWIVGQGQDGQPLAVFGVPIWTRNEPRGFSRPHGGSDHGNRRGPGGDAA